MSSLGTSMRVFSWGYAVCNQEAGGGLSCVRHFSLCPNYTVQLVAQLLGSQKALDPAYDFGFQFFISAHVNLVCFQALVNPELVGSFFVSQRIRASLFPDTTRLQIIARVIRNAVSYLMIVVVSQFRLDYLWSADQCNVSARFLPAMYVLPLLGAPHQPSMLEVLLFKRINIIMVIALSHLMALPLGLLGPSAIVLHRYLERPISSPRATLFYFALFFAAILIPLQATAKPSKREQGSGNTPTHKRAKNVEVKQPLDALPPSLKITVQAEPQPMVPDPPATVLDKARNAVRERSKVAPGSSRVAIRERQIQRYLETIKQETQSTSNRLARLREWLGMLSGGSEWLSRGVANEMASEEAATPSTSHLGHLNGTMSKMFLQFVVPLWLATIAAPAIFLPLISPLGIWQNWEVSILMGALTLVSLLAKSSKTLLNWPTMIVQDGLTLIEAKLQWMTRACASTQEFWRLQWAQIFAVPQLPLGAAWPWVDEDVWTKMLWAVHGQKEDDGECEEGGAPPESGGTEKEKIDLGLIARKKDAPRREVAKVPQTKHAQRSTEAEPPGARGSGRGAAPAPPTTAQDGWEKRASLGSSRETPSSRGRGRSSSRKTKSGASSRAGGRAQARGQGSAHPAPDSAPGSESVPPLWQIHRRCGYELNRRVPVVCERLYVILRRLCSAPADPASLEAGGMQCVLCMSASKEFMVVPCNHLCMCGECCARVQQQKWPCPMCRGPIQSVVRVFV